MYRPIPCRYGASNIQWARDHPTWIIHESRRPSDARPDGWSCTLEYCEPQERSRWGRIGSPGG